MVDQLEHTHRLSRRMTLSEFVRREIPHLHIASISQPEPELAIHNVVAVTDDIGTARAAVLELEALEADDAKLGLVVLSTDGEADLVDGRADPEGVTKMVASRTLAGGAIGALVGALLIGGATLLLADPEASTAFVAAFGGALLGGVFGSIWVVFAGMGGSDAYRQTFIAPELTEVCVVSLHTDDPDRAANGRDRLARGQWLKIVDVDVNGVATAAHHPNG
jgi:hypothetical protein